MLGSVFVSCLLFLSGYLVANLDFAMVKATVLDTKVLSSLLSSFAFIGIVFMRALSILRLGQRADQKKGKFLKGYTHATSTLTDFIADTAHGFQRHFSSIIEMNIAIDVIRVSAGIIFTLLGAIFLGVISPIRKIEKKLQWKTRPSDKIATMWAAISLKCFGIYTRVEGMEGIKNDGTPSLVLFSHASNIDAFAVLASGYHGVRSVFKQSLLWKAPFIFVPALMFGCIPIDRANREKAIASLNGAVKKMKENSVSIMIAPEGTRSRDGKLQEFKKGPFHMAVQAEGIRLVPVILLNNYNLWRPKQLFPKPGVIVVRYLKEIQTKQGDTTEELSQKVHHMMEEGFQKEVKIDTVTPLQSVQYAVVFHAIFWTLLFKIVF
ncbi:hypothetical protein PROFUN_00099 [Planoprotostelium fungivorum]|uniref:Phospholipid/glycerol acyltransferase domain-containing protein n=1 Tax=Planoprotostelium fungivorum TaxID=1890364 RepID=A0A2P6P0N7_9EUKA|nr:hypothetical protein PROFUN_00099 [Planoprotostelium fungivorum]